MLLFLSRIIAVILFSLGVTAAQAQSSPSRAMATGQKIEVFKKLLQAFKVECVDANNALKENPAWCKDEFVKLKQEQNELDEEVSAQAPPIEGECTSCGKKGGDEAASDMEEAVNKVLQDQKTQCGPEKETKVLSMRCVGEAAANLLRPPVTLKSQKVLFHDNHYFPEGNTTNCFAQLYYRIVQTVFSDIKGLVYDLPKLAARGAVAGYRYSAEQAEALWSKIWNVDKKTSDALLFATSQDNQSLKEWAANKELFMKKFATALFSLLSDFVKNDLGCEKWEGLPFHSSCSQPMVAWDCASCSQRLDVFCGVVGLLGGQLVSMIATGGLLGAAELLGEVGAKMAKAGVLMLKERVPEIYAAGAKAAKYSALTGKTLWKGARLTGSALRDTYEAVLKDPVALMLRKTVIPVSRKTLAFAQAKPALVKAIRAAGWTAGAIKTVTRAATYPASKYLELLDESYKFGYRKGRALSILARYSDTGTMLMDVMVINPQTIQQGDTVQFVGATFRPDTRVTVKLGGRKIVLKGTEDASTLVIDSINE